MEKFNTLDKVRNLFQEANCPGITHCYFICYRDTTKDAMKSGVIGGMLGGAVGGAIGAAVSAAASKASGTEAGITKADGYLFDTTESGIGIIPLKYNGVMMTINPSKMEPQTEAYAFYKNEDIESLVVKNYNIFNSKVKTIKLELKSGDKLILTARVKEKLIPYHEENFSKFVEKYSK